MNEKGVVSVTDYLPRPRQPSSPGSKPEPLLPWLIRRIECIRGTMPLEVQCAPAFNYARSRHMTKIVNDDSIPSDYRVTQKKALFESDELTLDLRYVIESTTVSHHRIHSNSRVTCFFFFFVSCQESIQPPEISVRFLDLSAKGHLGLAIQASVSLVEGQCITFVLRHLTCTGAHAGQAVNPYNPDGAPVELALPAGALENKSKGLDDPFLTKDLLDSLLMVRFNCIC